MIYSKALHTCIPVNVEKFVYETSCGNPQVTKYVVKDGKIPVGRVSLSDTPNGVFVQFIENFNPKKYGNFGQIADQIEVEHCLQRGLKDFEITSNASLNSHALHYIRGKRFESESINKTVQNIIENTPKGEMFNTKFLGQVKMYMPKELINKYISIIRRLPVLR